MFNKQFLLPMTYWAIYIAALFIVGQWLTHMLTPYISATMIAIAGITLLQIAAISIFILLMKADDQKKIMLGIPVWAIFAGFPTLSTAAASTLEPLSYPFMPYMILFLILAIIGTFYHRIKIPYQSRTTAK